MMVTGSTNGYTYANDDDVNRTIGAALEIMIEDFSAPVNANTEANRDAADDIEAAMQASMDRCECFSCMADTDGTSFYCDDCEQAMIDEIPADCR